MSALSLWIFSVNQGLLIYKQDNLAPLEPSLHIKSRDYTRYGFSMKG